MTAPRAGEPPLDQPYPYAPFGAAFIRFWKKGFTFTGRASRSEFWKAWGLIYGVIVAIYLLAVIVAAAASSSYDSGGLMFAGFLNLVVVLVALATAIPGIALFVRRLHDGNRSGAMYFLGLIPFVGPFILLVFMLMESDPRGAQYDLPGGARPSGGYGAPPAAFTPGLPPAYAQGGGDYGAPPAAYTPGLPPAYAQGGPALPPVPPPPAPAPAVAPVPPPPAQQNASALSPVPPPPPAPSAPAFAPMPPPPAAPSAPETFAPAAPAASAAPTYAPAEPAPLVSGVPGGPSASSSFVQPAASESDDDLDATRASVPSSTATWVLRLPDGRRLPVEGTLFIGRDPVGDPAVTHAVLVPVDDPLKSMSKTHARIDAAGGQLTVTDLHSTNGTTVRDHAGATIALTPGIARSVASDGQVVFGDYVAELGRNGR